MSAAPTPLRVVQLATGGVGRAAIGAIAHHPDLELVGCWVHDPAKAGVDAGELAGVGPLGVPATTALDAVVALGADCAVYAPVLPDPAVVAQLLAGGTNVVTPLGWFFPDPDAAAELTAACAAGGTTLHGTGIHPGGVTEKLPLVLSALSGEVTHVRAEEWSDIRTYDAPDVVGGIMLFGTTPEEAAASIMPAVLGAGFGQSIRMVAEALGFVLDPEIRSRHEVAVATAPIDSPIGAIAPGRVAAQSFTWEGTVRGTPVVEVRTNRYMGDTDLEPAWGFGPAGERFEVEVAGDPGVKATFSGWHPPTIAEGLLRNPGIVATANHCVNSIPAVVAAPPGIRTYLDLPLVAGRAAAHLR